MIEKTKSVTNWAPFLLGGAMLIVGVTGLGPAPMSGLSLMPIDFAVSEAQARPHGVKYSPITSHRVELKESRFGILEM